MDKKETLKSAAPLCHTRLDGLDNPLSKIGGTGEGIMKPALLLHSCCGPCSTSVIERLVTDYDITVFFYNPCITDEEEYIKRRNSQIRYIENVNINLCLGHKINFIEGEYEPDEYYKIAAGFSNEPEGGRRCRVCFQMRLEKTARTAACRGFEIFTTTLSVSPHKNHSLISEIGNELSEKYSIEFLDTDFKKKAGFQRSIQLSKEYGLYRQDYCGCQYSKRD